MNIFHQLCQWPHRFILQHGNTFAEKALYLVWHRSFDALIKHKMLWPDGQLRFATTPNPQSTTHEATCTYDKLICLTGFGHSGSGAVLDILSEYENVTAKGFIDSDGSKRTTDQADAIECTFAFLAGGIWTIEKILINGSMMEKDAVIKSFLSGVGSIYNPDSTVYGMPFLSATREFLDEIIDYFHRGSTGTEVTGSIGYEYCPHLKGLGENGLRCVYGDEAAMGIFKIKELEVDQFREIAARYIQKILKLIPSQQTLVLDQALSDGSADMEKYIAYFGDLKLIAVYRDPRDVYVTARTLGISWIPSNVDKFIKMYNGYGIIDRYLKLSHPNFMMLRFEDIVTHYDACIARIEEFTGLSSAAHINAKRAFDPDRSKNNVGIHTRHPEYAKETELIGNELERFCYPPPAN